VSSKYKGERPFLQKGYFEYILEVLMSTNAFYILLGSLGGITVIFTVILVIMHRRIKRLTQGKNGRDLEDTIITIEGNIKEMEKTEQMMLEALENIDRRLRTSIRAVETDRFNPFGDQGGNHSFAISLVNERGDGIVLSSLYSRERMSIFAKPIKKGKSEFELTEEEASVLTKGLASVKE
jgi:hypothetical protein